ncbi:MAG: AMP-dependent synthetase/ligase [Syntrophaceae bacterium]|nr:MAG: AMP-dependent synthetase/ligase [Syntrophaceae bacterium]
MQPDEAGRKKTDNVVVMLPNCPEVIISYQGILRCSGVIVPLIPLMAQKELTHILDNCEAAATITISDIFLKNESVRLPDKTLKNIILLDDAAPQGTTSFSQLINNQPDKTSLPTIGEEDYTRQGQLQHPKG